jgi:heme-degrading monooxygenase HmoA
MQSPPAARNLAQLNIAFMLEPADSPLMAEFFANVERINSLAEGAPGFVWRLKGDPPVNPFGANALVNLSVWRSVEALSDFVHKSGHMAIMRRRRQWFARQTAATTVLWWVPAGHEPDVLEAAHRLELLRSRGPSADAFTFATHHLTPA